jgi:hypothetical protein
MKMRAGLREELGDARRMAEEARKEVERVKSELSEADKRAVSALEQVPCPRTCRLVNCADT